MDFLEAVKVMKEGKKVKRQDFNPIYLDEDGCIVVECGRPPHPKLSKDLDTFEATDWEIVEEKKTLSDKIVGDDFSINDVKEAIKEFIEAIRYMGGDSNSEDDFKQKAKEIFGTRLV